MPIFRFAVPQAINGVNPAILNPRNNWLNKEEYDVYL
jgi:ATP-dependent phosphoenolpyruvate carboxykinase